MTRPFERTGIEALETIFLKATSSENKLMDLKAELEIRTTQRARTLLKKVTLRIAALRKEQPPSSKPLSRMLPKQPVLPLDFPGLFNPDLLPKVLTPIFVQAAIAPSAKQEPAVPLEVSIVQAYRTLKVTANASWETVEASRRELVSRAQPDTIVGLDADTRAQLQADAILVNMAYQKLLAVRQDNSS